MTEEQIKQRENELSDNKVKDFFEEVDLDVLADNLYFEWFKREKGYHEWSDEEIICSSMRCDVAEFGEWIKKIVTKTRGVDRDKVV